MAQIPAADFPINPATTSGTALANVLNRFNDAVLTNHSGATAPPEMFPGMVWLDMSGGGNGVLQLRNAANSAWLSVFNAAVPPVTTAGGTFTGDIAVTKTAADAIITATAPLTKRAELRLAGNAQTPGVTSFDLLGTETGGMVWVRSNLPVIFGSNNAEVARMTSTAFNMHNGKAVFANGADSSLTLNGGSASLIVNATNASGWPLVVGYRNAKNRWAFVMGDEAAETGGGVGANFQMRQYDDTGALIPETVFHITRGYGNVTVGTGGFLYKFTVMRSGVQGGQDGTCMLRDSTTSGTVVPILNCVCSGRAPANSNAAINFSDNAISRFQVLYNGGISNYSGNNVPMSDRRSKENFAAAGDYLDKLCAIPVQTFNYIAQERTILGVTAQDVEAVAPELATHEGMEVTPPDGGEPFRMMGVYETDLMYAMLRAIQELAARVITLEGATP